MRIVVLLSACTLLAGSASAQHIELGAFLDYGRPEIVGFPANAFGVGGRVNINLHRYLQAELEAAYDVKYANFVLAASSASVVLTNSKMGILHANGGANQYFPERTIQSVTGTPASVTTSTVSLNSFTHAVFYPGGGIGFHAGPLGIRVDVGDEIFWSSGAHHNLRVTFGPTLRF